LLVCVGKGKAFLGGGQTFTDFCPEVVATGHYRCDKVGARGKILSRDKENGPPMSPLDFSIEHCRSESIKNPRPSDDDREFSFYSPMQDVAPSAVRIALAIDTMICTTNLVVSFFVIIPSFLYY